MDERVRGDEAEAVIRRLAELQQEREDRDSDPTVSDVARLAGASEVVVRAALADVRRQSPSVPTSSPPAEPESIYERLEDTKVTATGAQATAGTIAFYIFLAVFVFVALQIGCAATQINRSPFPPNFPLREDPRFNFGPPSP